MMSAACDLAGLRKVVCGNWGRRSGIGLAAVIGLIVAAPSAALASAGCTALNGTFTGGAIGGSTSGTGFSAGDVITLTVTTAGGGDALGLYDNTTHNPLLLSTNAVGSRTYSVPADTASNFIISGTQLNAGSNLSWSCVAGGGSTTGTTDSQKLTNVQTQGSSVVANTSGANISGSVNTAIDNALSQEAPTAPGSGPSGTLSVAMSRDEFADQFARVQLHGFSPSGLNGAPSIVVASYYRLYNQGLALYDSSFVQGQVPVRDGSQRGFKFVTSLNFADDRSDVRRRADEAFAALGYAAVNKAPPRVAPVFAPQWSTWADVRGSGFEQSDSSALKGTQINAVGGVTYRLRPDLVVGAFAGYENFNYDFASLTGNLKGNGGTVGSYAGWQITPTLRWKGMIGWTGLGYDASAGTTAGNFDGSRWLLSTGLTGSHRVASFILEPSVDVFALWEHQTGYADTLGALHDSRNFSTGRVALGGRALAPTLMWSGVTPYLGFYGDYRFSTNNALPVGVPFVGINDGWSGRVTGGVNIATVGQGALTLGGEYGGIGANYGIWTATARANWSF